MELRQLRYLVRVVELGSISRAAADLGLVQSALSQQITRLESELSTRLLRRTARGVAPTEAGLAFFREAQLALRHADQAVRAAQQARLSGSVTIGLAPTTAAVLGLPLMQEMRSRYPDVRLHMVEGMSGHLTAMLNARELDLAVLFDTRADLDQQAGDHRWQVVPLLEEELYLIRRRSPEDGPGEPPAITLADLGDEPLILPTRPHGLRSTLDKSFAAARATPNVVLEIDSLAMVMAAVEARLGSSLQPWAALGRYPDGEQRFQLTRIADPQARRFNLLCTLPDEELSPAGLAARVVLRDCVERLVASGEWRGTALAHHDP